MSVLNEGYKTRFLVLAYDIEKLTPEVWANLGITQVNYPLSEQNGCKSLVSGKCPIEKGQTAIYHMTMPIANSFPKVLYFFHIAPIEI